MKKNSLFTFSLSVCLFLLVNNTFTQTTDKSDAQKVALNFYFERAPKNKNISYNKIEVKNYYQKTVDKKVVYHVFEINEGGFVIVSGSFKVQPVLAYSFDSPFDNNNIPENFKAWMAYYERQILYAEGSNIQATDKSKTEWERLIKSDVSQLKDLSLEKDVLPLLNSLWDQNKYYNGMCPQDVAGPGGRTYAGCVATAMGQLMYYHRWPISGTGSYSYLHPVYGNISADFENTQYDWESMPNAIIKPNKAISELLFNLGVSVDMDYSPDGSGMWNHSAARSLRNYFKYCPETKYVFKDSTTLNWDSILIANLDQKKPLYYAGWTQIPTDSSGHAFVCDGYQGFDYFHFNWGWSGSFNGYFYIDQLTPGGSDFNFRQELIKDIYPDTINYIYPPFCSNQKVLTDIVGSIEDGSANLNYKNNMSCSWLIAPQQNISNIKLSFDFFETESANDIVKVYNGETTSAPLLGTYSGSNIPPAITANGKKMLITFTTNDSLTAGGFRATYVAATPVYCTTMTTLSASSDTISDGSNQYNYNYLTNCRWRIVPHGAENITLNFISFQLDKDVDYLEIYDFSNIPNILLDKYTGDSLPATKTYNTDSLLIWFKTNTFNPKSGWKLFYNSSATSVNEIKDNISFNIFPNPTNKSVSIISNNFIGQDRSIKIFTLDGKNVYDYTLKNTDLKEINLTIDVDRWEAGLYVVNLSSSALTQHSKLIIYK